MPNRKKRADSPHLAAARYLSASIKDARVRAGMSQQELAERSKTSVGTIRAIETMTVVEPGIFTIRAIASALGVTIASLFDPDEEDDTHHR